MGTALPSLPVIFPLRKVTSPALSRYLYIMRWLPILLLFTLSGQVALSQCISGDCINGRGIYVYPSGAKYIGDFKNGEIHGVGTCYNTNGSKYQGQWEHRYPHGKGTKTYEDGYKYTGLWNRGKPVDANGNFIEEYVVVRKEEKEDITDIQSGCLSGDCVGGQGTFAYPDGSKYDGQFAGSKPNGMGTWYFPNGDRYVGSFRDNFPDGKGTFYGADGSVLEGMWRDGEYAGKEQPAERRTGCIDGDCLEGEGVFAYEDGSTYRGTFEKGVPGGDGVRHFPNGDRYEGEFQDGLYHGTGTLFLRDGNRIQGEWVHGSYQAPADASEIPKPAQPIAEVEAKKFFPGPSKVWAVVVGVAGYDHMPPLKYTDDDAYRFYAFLKSAEGGGLADEQIRILIDEEATRKNILDNATALFAKAAPGDLVLFYFSGHGVKGAFLPIDYDGYNNKISYEEISGIISASKASYRICLADACHSGGLFTERSAAPESEILRNYQALFETAPGTAVIMSSKAEETSLESSGLRQGVFSHFLIRGLKGEADIDADGMVSIQELYDFIYVQVRAYTNMRQSPVIRGEYEPAMPVAMVRR